MQKILFLPDIHVPYHDPGALKIAAEFARDWRPSSVCCLGDLMTADQVSGYDNECDVDLSDEFSMARECIDIFGVTHFLEGNHEERLRRVGLTKKNMRGLLDVRKNLELDKRGIHWRPYDPVKGVFKFGKLNALHGWFTSEYAARKHADTYDCCIFGHTHRFQAHQPKHAFEKHTGYNIGCLCKLEGHSITGSAPTGWSQGFAFMYLVKSGHFNLYPVRIIGGQVCIEGKVYRRGG